MPAAPRLLVLDTATETVVVAACGPSGEAVFSGPGGAAASAHLLPAVQDVLARAGLQGGPIDAVAFGAGPGAFTGLRTACAAAQGLAFGLGCPVLPLDDLAVWAEDSPWHDGEPVWVAIDARMDEVYAGAYRWRAEGHWAADQAPALFTLEALAARWSQALPTRVAGNAPAVFAGRLPDGGAQHHGQVADRASALLGLARAAWARGEARDAALALPVYLRDKVALTTAERAERAGHARRQAAP
jgi:tRNA threonylcarbamoyladenosine biosynthesis protein TsaB